MKTTKLTAVLADSYKSPEVSVTEICHEGPLCMSGKSFEEWEKAGAFTWDE